MRDCSRRGTISALNALAAAAQRAARAVADAPAVDRAALAAALTGGTSLNATVLRSVIAEIDALGDACSEARDAELQAAYVDKWWDHAQSSCDPLTVKDSDFGEGAGTISRLRSRRWPCSGSTARACRL